MRIQTLIEIVRGELVTHGQAEIIVNGCCVGESPRWVLAAAAPGMAWITGIANENAVAIAALANLGCIVFSHRAALPECTLRAAREQGVAAVCSPLSAYEIAGRLYQGGL